MKLYINIWIFACIFIMITTSIITLNNKLLDIKINKINRDIYEKRAELQELKAQWSYLNNKEYLNYLIDKHMPEIRKSDLRHDFDLKRLKAVEEKTSDG